MQDRRRPQGQPPVRAHNISFCLNIMLAEARYKRANTIRPSSIKAFCDVVMQYHVTYDEIREATMFLGVEPDTMSDGSSRCYSAKRLRRKVRKYLANSPLGPDGLGALKPASSLTDESPFDTAWSLADALKE